MNIELQIVLLSILAMAGIVGMPLYAAWYLWKKSGESAPEHE